MTKLTQMPHIELNVNLQLSMSEVQALAAIAGYGTKSFLDVFYTHMGKHYLKPHEAGLRSLFETIREELPPVIRRYKSAQTAFALRNPVVMNQSEFQERLKRELEWASEPKEPT